MTKEKKESPQSKLSKNLLVHALLELLNEKPYKQINITELTEKADLSRRTFYRHFTTIDEVLDFTLEQIHEQFVIYSKEKKITDLKSTIYVYFSYWQKRKAFLLTLKENGLLFILQNKFSPRYHQGKNSVTDVTEDVIEYAVWFTSGAIWSLLIKWLEDDTKYTPEEMADIVQKILQHLQG